MKRWVMTVATNDYVLDKAVYQAYQEDLITEQMPEAKKKSLILC